MSKKEDLIEKKSAVFSQDVYEYVSSDIYTLDDFEDALEPYWKQFQEPGLRLKFYRSFWPKFEASVKEHETTCTNADCRISVFKDELEVYLEQEIKNLSLVSGEGFDSLQDEYERYIFLRTAYLIAKDVDPGTPYSIMISSDEIGQLLEFPRSKVVKLITDLGENGFVENVLGAKSFMLAPSGYEYLLELEKGAKAGFYLSDSIALENDTYYPNDSLDLSPPLPAETRIKIFIIYSHKDKTFKEELEKHLRPLIRGNFVELLSDTQILPGQNWNHEIRSNLSKANLILIFVSSDLFASDYSEEVEVKEAFSRKREGDSTLEIIPILVRACDWKTHSEIAKLNLLPYNGLPVAKWLDQDEAYTKIIEGLKLSITRLNGQVFPK